jgi:hypothetical protein
VTAVRELLEQRGIRFEAIPYEWTYSSIDEARALGITADDVVKTIVLDTESSATLAEALDRRRRSPDLHTHGLAENPWCPRPGWHRWVRRADSSCHRRPARRYSSTKRIARIESSGRPSSVSITRTVGGFSSTAACSRTVVVSARGSFSRTNSMVARMGERARSGFRERNWLNPSTGMFPDSSGRGGPFHRSGIPRTLAQYRPAVHRDRSIAIVSRARIRCRWLPVRSRDLG